jgi:hypothetical protein
LIGRQLNASSKLKWQGRRNKHEDQAPGPAATAGEAAVIDHERVILGSLLMQPELLKISDDLSLTFFEDKKNRKAFGFINEMFEDGHSDMIDPRILADKIGGGEALLFVNSLLDGLPRSSPKNFLNLLREGKKAKVGRKIFRLFEAEQQLLKTTGNFDPSKIRPLYDEYDRLCQPDGAAILSLNTIEAKAISWLWPGRIPLAMLSLLVGDPGQGKSLLSIHLAALLSRGLPLPGSIKQTPAGNTLFLLGEDPLAQAVRPRADANKADTARLLVLADNFNLVNLNPLQQTLEKHQEVRLVVLDPLSAFFPPKTRYFEDPSVRQALLPLVALAEAKNVAILCVAHLRKQEAENVLHRVGGSVGLAALARSIIAIATDENDPDRRFLLPLKANYSRKPDCLAFRIQNDLSVVFESGPVQVDTDDVFSSEETKERKDERSFNLTWLKDYLRGGAKSVQETEKAAHEVGISRRTLYRIADRLGVLSKAKGEGRFKTWELRP